jgi:hypothetical protein
MFKQPKVLIPGLADELDLVDDIPDMIDWRAPFSCPSTLPPDGYDGLSAFWEVLDADLNVIARFYSLEAASFFVRTANKRNDIESPVVVTFKKPL